MRLAETGYLITLSRVVMENTKRNGVELYKLFVAASTGSFLSHVKKKGKQVPVEGAKRS